MNEHPGGLRETELLDRLAGEFVERLRRGEQPEVSQYADCHPELAGQIRDLFPALLVMERVRPAPGELAPADEPDSPSGQPRLDCIGDFRILREVGRGGMGIVYEAEQISLGRHVALKILPRHAFLDPRNLRRFHNEARAAARLHHTNIVPVFGVGQQDGIHYYIMQFIQGVGLDDVIAELRAMHGGGAVSSRDESAANLTLHESAAASVASSLVAGPPGNGNQPVDIRAFHDDGTPAGNGLHEPLDRAAQPGWTRNQPERDTADGPRGSSTPRFDQRQREYWKSVARVGAQVADALEYAHNNSVLHRDIKPANLLLDGKGTVWLTDFGLARGDESEGITRSGDIVGTMRYMAPEQLDGKTDARSDIYSLGVTLYEMLTLATPHDGEDRARLVRQILDTTPRRPRAIDPRIPVDLETIVLKAIGRLPADRYRNAAALAADLRRFLDDRPIEARRITAPERALRWCRRNPAVTGLVATVLLLASVLGIGAPVMNVVRTERDRALSAEWVARQSLNRAERAERDVKIRSHLSQATTYRHSGRMGQRFQCLDELVAAGRLEPSQELRRELRDEAIAAMGLTDLRVRLHHPVGALSWPQFDWQLQRYAFVDFFNTRDIIVRRLEDDRELLRVPRPDFSFWHATVDFTPDGQELLICYFPPGGGRDEAILHVWNLQNRECYSTHEIRSGDVVGAVAAHGRRLFFADRQGELCVWDLERRRELKRLPLGMTPYSICLDDAGERVAVNDYRVPLVRILDLENGDEIASWTTDVGNAAMAWSGDGQLLAIARDDGQIFVRHLPDGELISVLQGQVIRLAFANRGQLLATSGFDGITELWDSIAGQLLLKSVGQALRFSGDDSLLGYFVDGKGIGVWDVAHQVESRTLRPASIPDGRPFDHMMHGANFGAGGATSKLLSTCGASGVWIWNRATGQELAHLECGSTRNVLFRADGSGLVTNSTIGGLYHWPVRRDLAGHPGVVIVGPPKLLQELSQHDSMAAALLPDDRGVAVADNASQRVLIIPFSELDNGSGTADTHERIVLPSQHRRITSLTVSPNGRWVAAGGWKEPGIQVWNLEEKRLECVLPHSDSQAATIFQVDFAANNRWLMCAAASDDGNRSYLAYRVGTWERELAQSAEMTTNLNATFSADGRLMAQTLSPDEVRIVDMGNGEEIKRLAIRYQTGWAAAFSNDGSELVVVSGYYPVTWWNLGRLDQRLRELGLAWDSAPGTNEPSPDADANLSGEPAGSDLWSTRAAEAFRLTVQVDHGDLSQRVDEHEKASAVAELMRQASTLEQFGDWPQAKVAREKALEISPDDGFVQNGLAWLLATCPDSSLRDAPRALLLASRAVDSWPDNAPYCNTLGVAQYRHGDWRAAIDTLTRAEELEPGVYFAHNAIFVAMAHWQLDDRVAARDWFGKADAWLDEHPDQEFEQELRRFRLEAEELMEIRSTAD
jgi:eukaryotic-like serine/threonine-protein kinase